MKKNIAIAAGGFSSEASISLKSAKIVAKNINKTKFSPYVINISSKDWFAESENGNIAVDKNDFSIVVNGTKIIFDCVFIAIHGTPGEDGKLQGYFDLLKIPYTSCSQLASAITFSKWTCNTLLKQLGVNCAPSYLIRNTKQYDSKSIADAVGMPCFVKPNNAGSSFGVSKVSKEEELVAAIYKAAEQDSEVVIESFIKGTEVTCGTFRKNNEIIVLPITEIVSKKDFFDYEAKYQGASEEITPARISTEVANKIGEINRFVYRQLDLKGVVRIDYIIKDDVPFLIEVNTVPGLSEQSIVPQQARAHGISLPDFFTTLIEEALNNS